LQRIDLNVHPVTGRISQFRIKETIKLPIPMACSIQAPGARASTV